VSENANKFVILHHDFKFCTAHEVKTPSFVNGLYTPLEQVTIRRDQCLTLNDMARQICERAE
jgi:hypothetical protein